MALGRLENENDLENWVRELLDQLGIRHVNIPAFPSLLPYLRTQDSNLQLRYAVNVGSFAFNAVGDTADQTFAHGLGTTPVLHGGWQADGGNYGSGVRMHISDGPKDGTNIVLTGVCTRQPIAPTVACDCAWFAIG